MCCSLYDFIRLCAGLNLRRSPQYSSGDRSGPLPHRSGHLPQCSTDASALGPNNHGSHGCYSILRRCAIFIQFAVPCFYKRKTIEKGKSSGLKQ
jgi:hypothetical protein